MKFEASVRIESGPRAPPEERAVRVLSGRATREAVQRAVAPPSPLPSVPHKLSKAEFYMRRLAGWTRLDATLRHDGVKRRILRMSHRERRRALFGASLTQLERLVAFGNRWVEALEERHATEGAERFQREILADAASEIDAAFRASMPKMPDEDEGHYLAREDEYLRTIRGRLRR